jgi:tRNA pseudouridine55 synthase
MSGEATMPEASKKTAGFLIIDKPAGMSSREAVDRALGWFPRGTRGGHAGTLDPAATGVLVLCLGAATRLTEYIQRMRKTYLAGLRLGARSDTDDAEGTITIETSAEPPSSECVSDRLQEFIGEVDQVPPAFSAAKVSGRRAYDLARRGHEVTLSPKRVSIFQIGVLDYHYPRLELEVLCGKGTYIRSLARDLGQSLGCGALLESLRRTRIGTFDVNEAVPLDASPDVARSRILPVSTAVSELPSACADADTLARLRQGQAVPLTSLSYRSSEETSARDVAVFDHSNALCAVASVDESGLMLRPRKVFSG